MFRVVRRGRKDQTACFQVLNFWHATTSLIQGEFPKFEVPSVGVLMTAVL